MTNTMGAASSRVRLGDQRKEGQQKLNGRSLIASPHFRYERHYRDIS